ncbi:MAG: metal-sulfur cluster assembly factor [Candidatus Bipolaricaulota bacterium]|nr:metal-sulfur cluster assembly factor [Candidatus Bipolaricaulota bacterium]
MPTAREVLDILRGVTDPELGVDLVELGLVYGVEVHGRQIRVEMTLTSPACPLGEALPGQVEQALRGAFPGHAVEVVVVREPPWTPDRMGEEARRRLRA